MSPLQGPIFTTLWCTPRFVREASMSHTPPAIPWHSVNGRSLWPLEKYSQTHRPDFQDYSRKGLTGQLQQLAGESDHPTQFLTISIWQLEPVLDILCCPRPHSQFHWRLNSNPASGSRWSRRPSSVRRPHHVQPRWQRWARWFSWWVHQVSSSTCQCILPNPTLMDAAFDLVPPGWSSSSVGRVLLTTLHPDAIIDAWIAVVSLWGFGKAMS